MFFIHSFHLVARAKACVNDYRAALTAEKTAFTIYNSKVGKQIYFVLLFYPTNNFVNFVSFQDIS